MRNRFNFHFYLESILMNSRHTIPEALELVSREHEDQIKRSVRRNNYFWLLVFIILSITLIAKICYLEDKNQELTKQIQQRDMVNSWNKGINHAQNILLSSDISDDIKK